MVQSSLLALFCDMRPNHFRPLGLLKPLSLPPHGGRNCEIEAASDTSLEKLPVSNPVLMAFLNLRPLQVNEFSKRSGVSVDVSNGAAETARKHIRTIPARKGRVIGENMLSALKSLTTSQ
jgi:hypothetical protein